MAATQACQHVSRIVQRVLLAVSKAAVGDDGEDNTAKDDLGVSPPVPDDAWQGLRPFAVPPAAIRWYGDKVVRLILSWFWMATHGNPHEVIWMSQFQLYIDFMLSGEVGPTKIDGWRAGDATSHLDLLTVPFQVRARWFSRALRECLKHHGQGSTYRFCRPRSDALFLHTGCLAVPWDPGRLRAIDEWILSYCPGGIHRTSKAVDGLPFAHYDVRFPPVLISSW